MYTNQKGGSFSVSGLKNGYYRGTQSWSLEIIDDDGNDILYAYDLGTV